MSSGSTHVFSELYYHVTWHCHGDKPLLQGEMAAALRQNLQTTCAKIKGVHLKAVGGTETHVHLVFQAEPFVLLSELVQKLKGGSARAMNLEFGHEALQWQRGYGAVSFAKAHLNGLVKYVENQEEHHRTETIREVLERYRGEEG